MASARAWAAFVRSAVWVLRRLDSSKTTPCGAGSPGVQVFIVLVKPSYVIRCGQLLSPHLSNSLSTALIADFGPTHHQSRKPDFSITSIADNVFPQPISAAKIP